MNNISLTNRHLFIPALIAQDFLADSSHVHVVFYPQRQVLLLAPSSDELFKGLHKTSMQMVKTKNLTGDKSISLEEILLDHEIDESDRLLSYQLDAMNIMQVFF